MSSTTSTRTIVGHTTQRDAIILELDENLPKVPSFVACGTNDINADGSSFDGTGQQDYSPPHEQTSCRHCYIHTHTQVHVHKLENNNRKKHSPWMG